ncbi:transglutaminase domain-containing protein [Streptococcus merionis]|uniref:Beta antigen n=1 Tax=Streptococcus merionis TaxID=400065 RepID=A0A239SQ84_9STRE|nr:transglutaminase domain-containing protein [Streptococcus merionis]SNU87422.1 Beta antigen [Streptococcus merionis]
MNRKRMTTCQLALLTATAIGLSTLALNPAFAEQKNATVTASQSQKPSMSIVKSSLSNQEFVEKLKTEIKDSDEVRIWMLGKSEFWMQNVKLTELVQKIPNGYRFAVLNGKNSHDEIVFIVKDNDLLVNSEEEYTTAAQKKFQTMESQDVHGLFDLQRNNYDVILRSNGLSALKSSHIGINGLPLYSKTIGVTSPFNKEYGNHELTLDKIKENDVKLKELITASGADKAATDAEKVKLWTTYVTSNIPYDELAYEGKGGEYGYELSSDLFSVATRRKAMCVGFSIAAARAMNLLGMPAYVVSGALDGGGAHAATRVYFDGKWHTLEATTSWGELSKKVGKTSAALSYQKWRLDSYTLITKDNQDKTPADGTGYMIIDPDFEEWAKGQETSKLLYINTEAAFVNRTPFVISTDLKNKMQKMNEQLKTSLEALKAKDTENTYKDKIENLIKSVEEDVAALAPNKVVDIWGYEQYMKAWDNTLTFYNQLSNLLSKSAKNNTLSESTDFAKLKEEVEKQVKEEKEAHDKKLAEKTAKVYEEKKEEAPAKATFTPAEPTKSQESMTPETTDAQLTAKKKATISEITALKLPNYLANQYKTKVNGATSSSAIDTILNEAKEEAGKYSSLETEREKQKQIIWTTPNLLPGERDDYDKLLANASSADEMQTIVNQAKEKSAAKKVIFDKQAQLQSQVSNSQYLSSDEKAKLNSWIESSKTEKELEKVTKDINSAEETAKAQAEKAKERQEQERAELEAKQKQAEEVAQKAEAERQRLEEEKAALATQQEAAEAARLQAEAQAKLEREEAEKRRQAELEAEQKQAEETAQKAELERQRLAEEAAALEAQKQATETERLQAETQLESEETESLRQAELEAEQKLTEKKAQEEQAAQEAKELQRQAEEIAQKAEAERQRLEAEQAALIAQQQAAEAARLQAEAQAKLEREEAEKRQAELEAEQKQAEEAAQKAELERQRLAKEAAALAITPTETEVLSVEKAQAEQNHQNETTTSSTVEKELPIRSESTNSTTSGSTPKNENAAGQKQEVPSSIKTEEQAEQTLQAEPRTTLLQTQVGDTRIEAEFSKEMTEVNQLHAQKVEDHTLIQSVAQRVGVNAENVTIYDLTLAKDAHKVHSSESRTVRIAVSDTRKDYKVYHIKEDGTLELLPSSMENGKVVFNVNHFSKFAIVAVDKNEMANKKQLPQTGTVNWSGAFLGFGLMVLSLLGFKKRKEN